MEGYYFMLSFTSSCNEYETIYKTDGGRKRRGEKLNCCQAKIC